MKYMSGVPIVFIFSDPPQVREGSFCRSFEISFTRYTDLRRELLVEV